MSVSTEKGCLPSPPSIEASAPNAAGSGNFSTGDAAVNDMSYKPLCESCEGEGVETLATVQRWGQDLCASCDDRANERTHQSELSRYYGGSGDSAGSVSAFCARALAEKRGR